MEPRTAKEVTKLQELAYELRIGQAMTREVITISPQTTMAELKEVLRVNRISGAPVIQDDRMVGVISIENLIESLAAGDLGATVGSKMTRSPVTLYDDEPLVHAVSQFSRLRFGRFPVINRDGDLVGIVTEGDIARAMLKRLEVDYHEEEIHRYRASHIFEDIVADDTAIVLGYRVAGGNISQAGEASSGLKKTLSRLGVHPQIIRRVAVAAYEAEMNMAIFTEGGEIVAEVRPDRIKIEFLDKGLGIADIEQAMQPGFSTAPAWVREMGFGAGMGLPNIKACADEMQLDSTVGVGTHLQVIIYLDENQTYNTISRGD